MMPGLDRVDGVLSLAGASLTRCMAALQRLEPDADACYIYDLDALRDRTARFRRAFLPLDAFPAYAIKANALPELLEVIGEAGFGADAGSMGELHVAAACGFTTDRRLLNGNGRTLAEARWVAQNGVRVVNADLVEELDLLNTAAGESGSTIRVALRVNPGILAPGHRHLATGDDEAKFGISTREALDVWSASERWPRLKIDGVHVHVGSQMLDPDPLKGAVEVAFELVEAAATRGATVSLVNVGGGMGIDQDGRGIEFPLEEYASWLQARAVGRAIEWVLEPGRWVVAPVGVLLARILWVKARGDKRFVVIGAGMNDFIRPALYGARHRIEVVTPRPGPVTPAMVVGPVCESADMFAEELPLPPVQPGDLVALLDVGAYGSAMASTYNGRPRLPELVVAGGRAFRVRAGERPEDLMGRRRRDVLA